LEATLIPVNIQPKIDSNNLIAAITTKTGLKIYSIIFSISYLQKHNHQILKSLHLKATNFAAQ
jgi:hypothetical protein